MGTGFSAVCRGCGARRSYSLGIGMMDGTLEAFLRARVGEVRVGRMMERFRVLGAERAEYGTILVTCPKCEILSAKHWVRLLKGDQVVHESQFHCGRCRSLLVEAGEDPSLYRCRSCGQKLLAADGFLCWD